MTMIIFSLIYGSLIIAMGFFAKKYPSIISGYSMMSEEKKKNVDIERIANLVKKGAIVIGVVTIVSSCTLFWLKLDIWAGIALIAPLFLGGLLSTIVFPKYDFNKKSKFKKLFPPIFISVVAIIVVSGMLYGSRPTKVNMLDSTIVFKGLYGIAVEYNEIDSVELFDSIPPIKRRLNGFGLGDIFKGHFSVDKWGKCRLFLRLPNPPYLYIKLKNQDKIIFNANDSNYTTQLYQKLRKTLDELRKTN